VRDSTIWMSNIDTERDWRFRAEPSGALNGRSPALPMGKVLGGGSSINGLIWARGHKHDFDYWAAEAGDARWSYESVVGVYKRIEKWTGPDEHDLRGRDGLMEISLPVRPVPVAEALVDASAALGIPRAVDLNGKTMEGEGGCGIPNVTVRGERERVSVHPLAPIKFTYPNGRPAYVSPQGGTTIRVVVVPLSGTPQPGTGKVFINSGGGFVQSNMTVVSPNVYDAPVSGGSSPSVASMENDAEST